MNSGLGRPGMLRVLYMPTNKPSENAAAEAALECQALAASTGHDYVFALIEHGPSAYDPHSVLLDGLAREHAVPCLHVTRERWEAFLDAIIPAAGLAPADQDRMHALLCPDVTAYGAGPNKAALVAAALGADTLHRRDRDQVFDQRPEGKVFPGVLEAAAIGRKAGDLPNVINRDEVPAQLLGGQVRFVGSTVFGDPSVDRRDLLAAGIGYVADLEALTNPSAPRTAIEQEAEDFFCGEPVERFDHDFYEIQYTAAAGPAVANTELGRPEVGVSCVHRVFLEFPEMPIAETLTSDYLQKDLLYQLGYPVLFQSRKMRHCYDAARASNADLDAVISYALRDLRFTILWRPWSALHTRIRCDRSRYLMKDGSLNNDQYADDLLRASDETLPTASTVPEQFSAVYLSAALAATGEHAARLRAVADSSASAATAIIDQVASGIADYAWLVRRWRRLVHAAPLGQRLLTSNLVRDGR